MNRKIDVTKLNISLLFAIFLFSICFEKLSSNGTIQFVCKHIDEGFSLLFLCYVILNVKELFQAKSFILILWIFFLVWGGISNLYSQKQSFLPAIVDACIIVNRFMIGYFSLVIFQKKNNIDFRKSLYFCARILSTLLFLLVVHEIFFTPFWTKGDYRYFMNSLTLMFPHATYLAAASATVLILLGTDVPSWLNSAYMGMISFVGISTLRSKAIGFFLIYWFLYALIVVCKYKKYVSAMIIASCGGIAISWQRIKWNFFVQSSFSPRKIMLNDGVMILKENFPLGTGFATFGSSLAATYYSPIYTRLGYDSYWGMNPEDTSFLTDVFWPEIFAQFGFIGTIIFVVVILYFMRLSLIKMKINLLQGFAMLMTMIYLLIASVAESSFFNPTAFLFFIMFAIYEYGDKQCQ